MFPATPFKRVLFSSIRVHDSASVWSRIGSHQQVPHRSKTAIKLPYPPLSDVSEFGIAQAGTGKIYDKKPFKVSLVKGKKYFWCCCGWSRTQPFCDGTHSNKLFKIKFGPVAFIAPETMDYWLCNCKQTSQRPFCDGTHRNEEVQTAVRS